MVRIRIGTRGSKLALWQSEWVAGELRRLEEGLQVELVTIKTRGDKILDTPLAQVGGKGLFVKEIETALLSHEVDIAVHSLKDVPTEQPPGLCLAAFPERADPRDALISRESHCLKDLPEGATIGTSSLRRVAQLRHTRADLRFEPLRGNVDTRLRKLKEGQADAIVLACAGLDRLGLAEVITERLDPEVCLPAAGQGILAIECREDDDATGELLARMDSPGSRACAEIERHVVGSLGGSCQVPIGAYAQVDGYAVSVAAVVSDTEGRRLIRAAATASTDTRLDAAERVVGQLRDQAADEILDELLGSPS